ncbi:MAG: hypothetical protein ACTHLR_08675 [Rhizomicrobium sp.]
MATASNERKTISVPERANPLVRALYRRMAEQGVSYNELAARSGVNRSTTKAWRTHNSPGTNAIQATLNSVGLLALPIPRLDILPADLAADLQAIGERHGIPAPVAELMIVAAQRASPSN